MKVGNSVPCLFVKIASANFFEYTVYPGSQSPPFIQFEKSFGHFPKHKVNVYLVDRIC